MDTCSQVAVCQRGQDTLLFIALTHVDGTLVFLPGTGAGLGAGDREHLPQGSEELKAGVKGSTGTWLQVLRDRAMWCSGKPRGASTGFFYDGLARGWGESERCP